MVEANYGGGDGNDAAWVAVAHIDLNDDGDGNSDTNGGDGEGYVDCGGGGGRKNQQNVGNVCYLCSTIIKS